MGSVPPELSLDFRPTFVPKTISAFLKELSMIGNCSEKVAKLDDFIRRLEEEMRKIDAFKRELPLCMFLLNDAILALKEESLHSMASKAEPEPEPEPKPVLEEFIPMKKESENEGSKKERERIDKKRWMSTFQLYDFDTPKHNEIKRTEEDSNTAKEVDTFQIRNYKKGAGGGRAFLPYSDFPVEVVRKEEREELPVPSLSLLTPGIKNPREESGSSGSKTSFSRAVSSSAVNVCSLRSGPQQSQTARKQRRCWSPELHRRFVNALQQLGGSQSATPKQIRELMQVDGLTNDEVKSHLQKYRLHTRRAPGATATTPTNQSVAVLGGLWMPQDHCSESSKTNSSQSGSPQGPFQLGAPGSTTGGDSMDDEEDEAKSENYSWKSHIHKPIKSDV